MFLIRNLHVYVIHMNASFINMTATATASVGSNGTVCGGALDASKECGFYFYLTLGIFGPLGLIAVAIIIDEDRKKKRAKARVAAEKPVSSTSLQMQPSPWAAPSNYAHV
jgi:hypothetical protein